MSIFYINMVYRMVDDGCYASIYEYGRGEARQQSDKDKRSGALIARFGHPHLPTLMAGWRRVGGKTLGPFTIVLSMAGSIFRAPGKSSATRQVWKTKRLRLA